MGLWLVQGTRRFQVESFINSSFKEDIYLSCRADAMFSSESVEKRVEKHLAALVTLGLGSLQNTRKSQSSAFFQDAKKINMSIQKGYTQPQAENQARVYGNKSTTPPMQSPSVARV